MFQGIIFVKNDGKLTINGDTTAQAVLIQWGQCIINGNLDVADYITVQANPTGTMTVNGDVSANHISIEGGTLTINGTLYDVSQITIQSGSLTVSTSGSSKEQPIESVIVESGELHLCGNWFVNDMRINSGVIYVIPCTGSLEGSGTFFLECNQLTIEADGAINADGTGGDARGIGADGHDRPAGGGYGGKGGDGDFSETGGKTYGDNFSLTIEMGSRGGNSFFFPDEGGKGGGSISIISTGDVVIYGRVTANGGNGSSGTASSGGSGGSVLIYSPNLELTGSIAVNGGIGHKAGSGYGGGGGGGGRIKLFYVTGIKGVVGKLSVNGGSAGAPSSQPGQNGTIWTDAIPNPPELIAPEDGASLANYRPTFRFNVIDASIDTDNRDDDLGCRVELSTDNFATIYKIYDQNVSLSGWSKFSYKSGDDAEFTPTEDLPQGVYQWRAAVRDKSVKSKNSLVQSFTVGTPPLIRVEAHPSSLPPDGKSTSLITATVTSPEGKPITDEIIEMSVDDSGKISEVTNKGDGTYTATYTAGDKTGTVTITAKATKANVSATVELTLTSPVIYQTEFSLTKGINMISLPLSPETPYTASTLAAYLNSTIVIQVDNGRFDAYVRAGSIGTDFPIQMGQGYIVNLMEAQTFEITGKPWGEPVPAAPSTRNRVSSRNSVSGEPWAFVIAGHIEGTVPDGGCLRITNLRTGEKLVVPLSSVEQAASLLQNELAARSTVLEKNELAARFTGEFTAAFVDMNRSPVIAEGDEFTIQLIGMSGVSLAEAKRYIISHKELEQAYLLAHISARVEKTTLLPNYPNPFNPETWIPYKLASDAVVRIAIYDINGALVRQLSLGYQKAGYYVDRLNAAYWDGRNALGEKVASGLYFYQFTAGDFIAMRRMVILK